MAVFVLFSWTKCFIVEKLICYQ